MRSPKAVKESPQSKGPAHHFTGRKNSAMIGAGRIHSLTWAVWKNCRRLGVDPCAYLRDILTLLPRATNRQIPELTPQAWAKARRATADLQAAA